MRTRFYFTVALPLLVAIASAQQFPSAYPGALGDNSQTLSGQNNQVNCSDPTMAESSQCMQTQGGNVQGNPSMGMPGSSGGTESSASQPGRVTTYSDERTPQSPSASRAAIRLAPEPLTEFQRFTASTTGQILPIFGANLFQNVPSTFAPIDNAPIPPDYVVGPNDELRVRVWGQVNFNANVHVARSGDIYLPQIGAVHVAGLHASEVEQHLHEAISKIYRHFELSAELGEIRAIQVYVAGEARRPGVYTVSSLSTLIDALFASGGPSVQGSMRRIELKRAKATVTTFDLYQFLVAGDKSKDVPLMPGDLIFIPSAGQQVAVIGSVRRPAIYELLPGDTIADALRDAGSVSALASDARVSLERTIDHSERQAMEVKLDAAGKATVLEDGDILNVLSMVSRYQKTVTLRGNTANPGRFAWHAGMHLSDLIPDRDSLITRDYWWKRVRLGLPALEFEPVPALSAMRQPTAPIDLRNPHSTPATSQNGNDVSPQPNGNNPNNTDQGPTLASQGASAYGMDQGTQQAGAVRRDAATQGSQSALAEEDAETPDEINPRATQKTVVRMSVPEIDWSYAVIERMDAVTLKTTLIPFDLGKLIMQHDTSQDLELLAGDVVTVFSQSDIHVPIAEQTSLVHLEGEFIHSGTYSVQPGETLRSLVQRSGGLTPNAYLYGSVFTRESTRVIQQRRMDESIHEMTLQMQRGNLALASSPISSPQDLVGMSAAQASERELIAQLQQIRTNGRIVFEFTPDTTGADKVPDIPLENGDTFLIPSVPSTVNVVGAVFNQNSFLFRPRGQTSVYLQLAGGPNADADRKRMFVIRANGAVVSRTSVKGAWGDEFFHLKVNPGDTIIVPEKSIKASALRGIIDWSQIFSQFAIGAAAINILR
jgi:protein involved in polysaccharide export with SLBB domain